MSERNDGHEDWMPDDWPRATPSDADTPLTEPVSVEDPEFRALSNRIHRMMADDPLMGPCGGTHMLGYGTCQRIALIVRTLDATRATEPGLREAAEWLVKVHADDVTITRGSALWEDLQALKAVLRSTPDAPRPETL